MTQLKVVSPGLQTTVQDTGRPGFLHKGIPPSGAQDSLSFRLGQLLVGNDFGSGLLSVGDPGAAGLEMLLMGPTVEFTGDAVIALTGGEVAAQVDGHEVPMWEALSVGAGSVLSVKIVRRGARAYLAVRGGLEGDVWLGSRSTFLRAGCGGRSGRALVTGDVLDVGSRASRAAYPGRLPDHLIPAMPTEPTLRTVVAAQSDLLTPDSVEEFFGSTWTLSPVADRTGFRFTGPAMRFRPRAPYLVHDAGSGEANIVDDVTPLGGIQVPGGGQAIVFGVDVTSAGGYAKVGVVIASDLRLVGQLRPGSTVRFEQCAPHDGVAAAKQEEALLAELASATAPVGIAEGAN